MIDWMMGGALMAVLIAELFDAWALRQLTRRCDALPLGTPDRARLVRWYAEGFLHCCAVTKWLRAGSLVLAILGFGLGAHPAVLLAALLLAAAAHGESRFGAVQRRRYLQASSRCVRRAMRATASMPVTAQASPGATDFQRWPSAGAADTDARTVVPPASNRAAPGPSPR